MSDSAGGHDGAYGGVIPGLGGNRVPKLFLPLCMTGSVSFDKFWSARSGENCVAVGRAMLAESQNRRKVLCR